MLPSRGLPAGALHASVAGPSPFARLAHSHGRGGGSAPPASGRPSIFPQPFPDGGPTPGTTTIPTASPAPTPAPTTRPRPLRARSRARAVPSAHRWGAGQSPAPRAEPGQKVHFHSAPLPQQAPPLHPHPLPDRGRSAHAPGQDRCRRLTPGARVSLRHPGRNRGKRCFSIRPRCHGKNRCHFRRNFHYQTAAAPRTLQSKSGAVGSPLGRGSVSGTQGGTRAEGTFPFSCIIGQRW